MDVGESEITKTTLKSVKFDVRNKKICTFAQDTSYKLIFVTKVLTKITVHII